MPALNNSSVDSINPERKAAESEAAAKLAELMKYAPQKDVLAMIAIKLDASAADHKEKLREFKQNRQEVADFDKVIALINNNSSTTDGLKLQLPTVGKDDPDNLYQLLTEIKAKYTDTKINVQESYTKIDCDKLLANLNRGLESRKLEGTLIMEGIQHAFNERIEVHQYARSIMKACHDTGTQMARNIAK